MYAFNYHRPQSVAEAAKLLQKNDDTKLLSGGMTFIPTLKQRLASPSDVVDLGRIEELKKIEVGGRSVVIGAGVCHTDVASSTDVTKAIAALAKLASSIGEIGRAHV